jgi:hypothetical protein
MVVAARHYPVTAKNPGAGTGRQSQSDKEVFEQEHKHELHKALPLQQR